MHRERSAGVVERPFQLWNFRIRRIDGLLSIRTMRGCIFVTSADQLFPHRPAVGQLVHQKRDTQDPFRRPFYLVARIGVRFAGRVVRRRACALVTLDLLRFDSRYDCVTDIRPDGAIELGDRRRGDAPRFLQVRQEPGVANSAEPGTRHVRRHDSESSNLEFERAGQDARKLISDGGSINLAPKFRRHAGDRYVTLPETRPREGGIWDESKVRLGATAAAHGKDEPQRRNRDIEYAPPAFERRAPSPSPRRLPLEEWRH